MQLDDLNPPQRDAVAHGTGPLLILAGAGSGKTRVITHRLARLVHSGVQPWRILAVTFTNKAAGEMRERAARLLGSDEARRMWVGTFHSTCARLLRQHASAVGLTRDFVIYDDDDQKRLVSQIMKEAGLANYLTARQIRSRIDDLKNQGITVGEFVPSHYLDDHVATVYAEYQKRLRAANAVDFGDLLLEVLRLTEHDEVGPLLASRFDHVLVDEFQDTNKVQFRLVKRLAWRGNLCVVGDDDQSIYSWRGADVRNILEFDRAYGEEGLQVSPVKVIKLEQNYRSTQVILEAANHVIERNVYRKSKRLFTERDGGDPIVYNVSPDERTEAANVVRAIATLTEDEGRALTDIAVLYRMNAQSRVLEAALQAARIPYRIFGSTRFFDRAEVYPRKM